MPLMRILLLVLCGLAPTGGVLAAGLDASLDRTRIPEGDSLTLQLSAPSDAQGNLDLTPLAQDFDLLNQSQGTQMRIINGHAEGSRQWQLRLAPKRVGSLTVPSLTLGNLVSKPLTLEVLPAAQAAAAGEARPVLVEVEANTLEPLVQGQVLYQVRILARVPLRQASLTDPKAGDALVERLGEDKNYRTQRDGQSYQVIERRYAIFPQRSGALAIEPPLLTAQIPDSGGRRSSPRDRFGRDPFADLDNLFGQDPFANLGGGLFESTRQIQLRGQNLTLNVKPQPPGGGSPWLPAESLQLTETWSPEPPQWRVGEPVTRTLAITVQGLSAAQLPDLNPPVPEGIRAYPDQPQAESRSEGDALVAQKVVKIALVPAREGHFTLPEVRLSWWDTQAGQARQAVLPARTLTVAPGAGQAPQPAPAPSAAPAVPVPAPVAGAAVPPAPVEPKPDAPAAPADRLDSGPWPWVAAGLAGLWLATLLTWWWERRRRGAPAVDAPASAPGLRQAKRRLELACRAGDPHAARAALLDWGRARWPDAPPRSLEGLGARLGPGASEELDALNRVLYGQDGTHWQGSPAWTRLAAALVASGDPPGSATQDVGLPPLYPGHAGRG